MLNLEGRIGGDADLSHRGEEYALKLPELVLESVGVSRTRNRVRQGGDSHLFFRRSDAVLCAVPQEYDLTQLTHTCRATGR